MPTLTGRIESMRKDRTGIKVNGDWYSSYQGKGLADVEYGDTVTFEYVEKGPFKNIKGSARKAAEGDQPAARAASTGSKFSNHGVEVGHAWNSAVQIAMSQSEDPGKILELAAELTPRVYSICFSLRELAENDDLKMENPFDIVGGSDDTGDTTIINETPAPVADIKQALAADGDL